MINRKLTTAILCCGLSVAPVTSWGGGFLPAAGVDNAPSLGRFIVTFTANFVRAHTALQNPPFNLCSDPDFGICPDEKRTIKSPNLTESQTSVGRSDPHYDGDTVDINGANVCQIGTWDSCRRFFRNTVKDSDFFMLNPPPGSPPDINVVFPDGKGGYKENGPVGTQEVHTQMLSLDMKNGRNAVRAGGAAPDRPRSIGEVQSLDYGNANGKGGFPAESFFHLYVEVDMDLGSEVVTLYNLQDEPLVIISRGLKKFPPKLVYTHSATEWAVPLFEKGVSDDVVIAYILMAGHGIDFDCGTSKCTRKGDRRAPRKGDDLALFDKLFNELAVAAAINPEKRAESEFDPDREGDKISPPVSTLCRLYGVQDHGKNDSQLYAITPDTLYVQPISKIYRGFDIESLATRPSDDLIYMASGNDSEKPGYLYNFDVNKGNLIEIGDTGFNDVPGIAFHPDGTLWGWVKNKGLITIDTETGDGTMVKAFPGILVEDITWNTAGTHIYASENTNLWIYDHATQTAKLTCSNLPGETEALEMLPDGSLLLGIHGEEKFLQFQSLNLETCEIVFGVDIPTSASLNDVEGMGWPIKACSQ